MLHNNNLFQALADPTRRAIINLLKQRDMTPSEIITSFTITKPSLSHHLEILKRANLVIAERKGQNIFYSLNLTVVEEMVGLFLELFSKPEKEK